MVDLHPQFVTDATGKRVAIQLSMEEFERLLEQAEMAEDIVAYESAKAEAGDAIPLEDFLRESDPRWPTASRSSHRRVVPSALSTASCASA